MKKRLNIDVFHLVTGNVIIYLAFMCAVFRVVMVFLLSINWGSLQSQVPHSLHAFPPVTGTYGEHQSDVNSFRGNAASLARSSMSGLGVYAERPYLLKTLSRYYMSATILIGEGAFGAGLNYTGGTYLNQSEVSVAYGRRLASLLDIGAEFHYVIINQAGYGNKNFAGFEIGILMHPANDFVAGIKIRDPQGIIFNKRKEVLPSSFILGLGYEASPQFLLSVEISREEGLPVEAGGRLQYQPHPAVRLRSGFALGSHRAWFSAGFLRKNVFIDISAAYHVYLGLTPGIQLSIHFPGKEK